MSELASIGCCCGGERCYYVAIRCECPEGCTAPLEGLIDCNIVENIVQFSGSNTFVFRSRMFCGQTPGEGYACYTVGLGSQKIILPLPPESEVVIPPQLDLQTTPWTEWVFPSCEDCCDNEPPVFCWAIARACNIPGDPQCTTPLGETVYVPLGFQVNGQCPEPTLHIWQYAGRCIFIAADSTIVNTIPPGAIESPAQAQFPSCIECCGEEPPAGCPLICNGCPSTLTISVPAWNIVQGSVTIAVQGGQVPVQRLPGTCQWETFGDPIEFQATITEAGFPPEDLPFFLSGEVSCSTNFGWIAGINGSVQCSFVSNNFDPCPFAGSYNCQMPAGACADCPPNVSVG